MNNIIITLAAPELVAAVNNLADALRGNTTSAVTVPSLGIAPNVPAQPPVAPAPTAAPAYTLEQLAQAATPLIDAGKQAELQQLLAQYGVQALTFLPQKQYGAFATGLRGLGAKI